MRVHLRRSVPEFEKSNGERWNMQVNEALKNCMEARAVSPFNRWNINAEKLSSIFSLPIRQMIDGPRFFVLLLLRLRSWIFNESFNVYLEIFYWEIMDKWSALKRSIYFWDFFHFIIHREMNIPFSSMKKSWSGYRIGRISISLKRFFYFIHKCSPSM